MAGAPAGELRLAYVSCNGQEVGDRERNLNERNALWQRLADADTARPLHVLLHGGDQIYADEMLDVHPALRAWRRGEEDQRRCRHTQRNSPTSARVSD
ncbi:MAG: hypothetical protein U5L11_17060 [Arhodomonas sp.]|nr:hypothetical protein [Arhodomonas sp.]